MLNGLVADGRRDEHIRNKLVFKIVPMLNPDGVIHSNHRTSLHSIDLNRCWNDDRKQCPEVLAIKGIIRQTIGNRLAFFDLHGHSKKKGLFAYGCMNRSNPFLSKYFPYFLHNMV